VVVTWLAKFVVEKKRKKDKNLSLNCPALSRVLARKLSKFLRGVPSCARVTAHPTSLNSVPCLETPPDSAHDLSIEPWRMDNPPRHSCLPVGSFLLFKVGITGVLSVFHFPLSISISIVCLFPLVKFCLAVFVWEGSAEERQYQLGNMRNKFHFTQDINLQDINLRPDNKYK
jgi:hypothetical protein